ncbi:beta-lactamase family protein [Paenibacillus sp. IB182496]|uniref:Beta-lactamase family protein n=1 Tax=Paenibacillus sabuli TaxID=2772509 RepID=A0A927GT48_9BACL|nr:serine hydrolase domain-containing protein [Paenibacillus sabuli]MBD2846347.1 beta-lactamase family protein [Paenibacillus sabuli]
MLNKSEALLRRWDREGLVPGGVCCVRVQGKTIYTGAFGEYCDNHGMRPIRPDTPFDLASLTKVIITLPVILGLIQEGTIGWNEPVSAYLDPFTHKGVKIKHLLQHLSGLPADLPIVPRSAAGRDVLGEIYRARLESEPGRVVRYSDLGMILLGELASRVGGRPIERLAQERVLAPLDMRGTGYAVQLPELTARAAATEYVDGRYLVGEVHDEKTWQMGGASGSAGLFGTAEDLARYTDVWLDPGAARLLSPDLAAAALAHPRQGRGLGWEVHHDEAWRPVSCGLSWPPGSFGHTGFTGTSIWCEPQLRLAIVWLTNAVHAGRDRMPVRALRRILHDSIREELGG